MIGFQPFPRAKPLLDKQMAGLFSLERSMILIEFPRE
jgi:hypothetical protein